MLARKQGAKILPSIGIPPESGAATIEEGKTVATTITTILGAGGAIGNELARILAAGMTAVRLVGRNPKPVAGAELFAADLSDREQTIRAVAGSSVGHLLLTRQWMA